MNLAVDRSTIELRIDDIAGQQVGAIIRAAKGSRRLSKKSSGASN